MNAVAELDAALARIHRDIDRRCARFLHREARSAGQKRRRDRERMEAALMSIAYGLNGAQDATSGACLKMALDALDERGS